MYDIRIYIPVDLEIIETEEEQARVLSGDPFAMR